MIENGTLYYKTVTGGGIDPETGDPIPATSTWSSAVPCYIKPNSTGRLMRYEGGQYVSAAYEVHIEKDPTLDLRLIKIIDAAGALIGEFQIVPQNIQHLEYVERIKIVI